MRPFLLTTGDQGNASDIEVSLQNCTFTNNSVVEDCTGSYCGGTGEGISGGGALFVALGDAASISNVSVTLENVRLLNNALQSPGGA